MKNGYFDNIGKLKKIRERLEDGTFQIERAKFDSFSRRLVII